MTLSDLGYSEELEDYRKEQGLDIYGIGRISSVHRGKYRVKTVEKEYDAEIIGNIRFGAHNRSDLPAVGDWVAVSEYDDTKVLIHAVFPRKTVIEREAVGKQGEKQIIAVNIDYAFIVQAVDRDFNVNRIERYLTICNTSNVSPIIVLSKVDLIDDSDLESITSEIRQRIKEVLVITISNETLNGIAGLNESIIKGKTYCLLGSSGVGKSTLLNNLAGRQVMKTGKISTSTNKGRHVTSHRELIVLENGGILIDNPGMRDVGIADSENGLEMTFDPIIKLSEKCRFNDCTHTIEKGCAVLAAIEAGELDKDSYENYMKMENEKAHYESTIAQRRKKDKNFGKMLKNYKKGKKSNKY